MKLASIFSNFIGGAESHRARIQPPPMILKEPFEQLPADPYEDEDQIIMSQEAAFFLAAKSYNPERMTAAENRHMADLLLDSGAISARDHSTLLDAPRPRTARGTIDNLPRNFLADWQMRLASDMGSSNFNSIDSSSRALSILGRLASAREEML